MAGIRQGVIKKDKVEASGARSADESLFGTALRIPSGNVKMGAAPDEATAIWQSHPLLRRALTASSGRSVDVRTRHIEPVHRPKPKTSESTENVAELTAEEKEAAWKLRLEEARESAFAEGREEGHAAAKAEFDQQVADLKHEFAMDLDAVHQSWKDFLRRNEPHLVQLAFRLSRTVLDAPLPDDVRRISERVVADAVERMATDVAVEIIVHPVSYLRIQEAGIEDQLNAIHSKLRWRTNPDLQENEWVVQSPRAATRRIEAELIDELQRELASPSPSTEATD